MWLNNLSFYWVRCCTNSYFMYRGLLWYMY